MNTCDRLKTRRVRYPLISAVFSVSMLMVSTDVSPQGVQIPGAPTAKPEDVGISSERLDRARAYLQAAVDDKKVAGAVGLIARRGEIVFHEAFGSQDIESGKDMKFTSMFRIASMSKAITSVAVMLLHEGGSFRLNDPVSRHLPEFKGVTVLVETDSDSVVTRKAKKTMRVRHLLNHTSGLAYGGEKLDSLYYKGNKVSHGLRQTEGTIGPMVERLASIPLAHEPGEKFTYGLSTDVLGRLVEVLSGKPFDVFLKERLFAPLGMRDTHFFIPKMKMSRMAAAYKPKDGSLDRWPDRDEGNGAVSAGYPYDGPTTHFSGGGGLTSTSYDYWIFCQMLLNGGELDGVRILSRKTVELMTANSVGDLRGNNGFGLGFDVQTEEGDYQTSESIGSYGWGGYWGTKFRIDPLEELIVIGMTQLQPNDGSRVCNVFQNLVYQAIID